MGGVWSFSGWQVRCLVVFRKTLRLRRFSDRRERETFGRLPAGAQERRNAASRLLRQAQDRSMVGETGAKSKGRRGTVAGGVAPEPLQAQGRRTYRAPASSSSLVATSSGSSWSPCSVVIRQFIPIMRFVNCEPTYRPIAVPKIPIPATINIPNGGPRKIKAIITKHTVRLAPVRRPRIAGRLSRKFFSARNSVSPGRQHHLAEAARAPGNDRHLIAQTQVHGG